MQKRFGAKSPSKAFVSAGSLVALAVAIVCGIAFGTDPVSLARAIGDPTSIDHAIVFDVRLPRVLLGAVAGAGLSIVGVALQALLRNPLAEPYVLGVSGGSAASAPRVRTFSRAASRRRIAAPTAT